MAQETSEWQVRPHSRTDQQTPSSGSVPLKWACDALTGVPRYIHDVEVSDGRVKCHCPACNHPLIPVLPGQPLHRNPTSHFRHSNGAQKDDCTLVAARLAAVRHLQEQGFIDLPRRRRSASAVGFSGQGYEGWAETPEQRILIAGAVLQDHATALLTLPDGRELLVDLTGQREVGDDGLGRAVVTLFLSDPAVAMMDPQEIRARLRLLPDIHWCSHWDDETLDAIATGKARQAAVHALDAWGDEDESSFELGLSPDLDVAVAQQLRRETLLHSEVKTILAQASHIAVPGLKVEITRHPPEELGGEWADDTLRMSWSSAPATLTLKESKLERRQGTIVPDLICTLQHPRPFLIAGTETWLDDVFEELIEDGQNSQRWHQTLLIEVTVTHGIDQEKLRRVQALDLPTLEINLGALGGRVTREGLRRLVVEDTVGKCWVHHPTWRMHRGLLEAALDQHPVTLRLQERLAEVRRPRFLATSASEWASLYLAAATELHDANTAIEKARRSHQGDGPKPVLLRKDSEPWQRLMEAAEALDVHGYPGAASWEMTSATGIVSKLLSIQHDRGIGYDYDTGYQVLDAIMRSGSDYQQWHTLNLIAVKTYGFEATFTAKQADRYASWRQSVIAKVNAGDVTFLRPERYDAVLSVLFPQMAARLAKGFGRASPSA